MTSPGRSRVYLDTNVFVAAFEGGLHADRARSLMAAIDVGACEGVTSELTLAELLVRPLRLQDQNLVLTYRALITDEDSFHVLPVRRDVIETSAALRASRLSLKIPDAIHVATAVVSRCNLFVSDDKRLAAPGRLVVTRLDDPRLDILMNSP